MKTQVNCSTQELYQLYRRQLLDLINSRIKDQELAKDILHDAFEKIEKYCQRGSTCDYPRSFIFRTVINTISDHYRQQKCSSRVSIDDFTLVFEDSMEQSFDVYACISEFLKNTSLHNREAFMLVDIQQMPQTEAAKKLQIPLSTLKSRVQRTRKFLKEEFISCLKKMT